MKYLISIILLSLLLAGCVPLDNLHPKNEQESEDDNMLEIFKTPDIKTHEKYYQSLIVNEDDQLKLSPGAARGEITGGPNNRVDIDELELGLMRLAQEKFNVNNYYYQSGKYLSKQTIRNWLGRSNSQPRDSNDPFEQKGLNPEIPKDYDTFNWEKKLSVQEDNPRLLSYVLEQNYLTEGKDGNPKLSGLAIGLSFNSTYYFRVEDKDGMLYDGQKSIDLEKLKQEAKKTGEQVIARLRQHPDLKGIPIVIGLYIEEERGSVVPGNYFAKANVDGNESVVEEWENVNETYYYFPSSDVESDYREDSNTFNLFKSKVLEFYPEFIGVNGRGFYKDNQLSRLTIEIPIQFSGKGDVISFTQFLTHLVKEHYPNEVVRIYVTSAMGKQESVIISDPNEDEPIVHIYR